MFLNISTTARMDEKNAYICRAGFFLIEPLRYCNYFANKPGLIPFNCTSRKTLAEASAKGHPPQGAICPLSC